MILIDKEQTYQTLSEYYHHNGTLQHMALREALDRVPVVDAVPVIRCKDCKWYYRGGATCMFWDGANGMCGDDFCGKAERAEE